MELIIARREHLRKWSIDTTDRKDASTLLMGSIKEKNYPKNPSYQYKYYNLSTEGRIVRRDH